MRLEIKKEISKKIIATVLLFAVVFSIGGIDSQAASKSWSLRYIKGAPGSDQINSWSKTVTTKLTTTQMTVSKVGGGATIFVYTDNGIASLFSGAGSTSVAAKKGVSVYAYVKFESYGNSNSYPAGSLSY